MHIHMAHNIRSLLALVCTGIILTHFARASSLNVTTGQAVQFNVSVQGTAPFAYQWQKNGVAISSATGSTYTIAAANTADAATYSVIVFNAAGYTFSDAGVLTVNSVTAAASVNSGAVAGSGFETPNVGANTYFALAYSPTGTPWTFTGNAGITGNNSAFTDHASAAPEGVQAAFIQSANASIAQQISFAQTGYYTLVLSAASRGGPSNLQLQAVNATIDGSSVGTFTPSSASYETFAFPFYATAGLHTLRLQGTVWGDSTTLFDDVVIIGP